MKPIANTNGHSLSSGSPHKAENLLRPSELNKEDSGKFRRAKVLSWMSNSAPQYIMAFGSWNGMPTQIRTTITFNSDVRLKLIIYWDLFSWKMKPIKNSNHHNFSVESPNKFGYLSRNTKFNKEDSGEFRRAKVLTPMSDWAPQYIMALESWNGMPTQIRTAITFYSDVG